MERLHQILAFARKQQFWLLSGLAFLVALVCWFIATTRLATDYTVHKNKVASTSAQLDPLINQADNPNDKWVKDLQDKTEELRSNIRSAWDVLYKQQKAQVFIWPKGLRSDFLAVFDQPGAEADRRKIKELCERYQVFIKGELKRLADLMDANWDEEDSGPGRVGGRGAGRGAAFGPEQAPAENAQAKGPAHRVVWESGSQKDLVESYDWQDPPSMQAVRFAQEDLWVMEALCRAVAKANEGSHGPPDAVVRGINSLTVGYEAAGKFPLGEGEKRIERLAKSAGTGLAAPAALTQPGGPPAADAIIVAKRPAPNAGGANTDYRNTGMSGMPLPGAGHGATGGAPAATAPGGTDPDGWLKEGRYVDDRGRSLPAKAVDAPPYPEFNLMPFDIEVVVDERRFDKFYMAICNSTLPLEIRQIRINSSEEGEGDKRSGGGRQGATLGANNEPGVFHNTSNNILVEIQGVAYLINPPNLEKLGISAAAGGGAPAAALGPAAPGGAATPTGVTPAPAPGSPSPPSNGITPPGTAPLSPAPPGTIPPGATPPATPPITTPPALTPSNTAPPGAATPGTVPSGAAPPGKAPGTPAESSLGPTKIPK